jgi:polysaccharide biosynthesis transport protein
MELRHYFAVLRRWAWLIVLMVGLAIGISYRISIGLQPLYSSTTTLMVGQVLQAQSPSANDLATSEQLAQTYSLFVRRQPILEGAAEALNSTPSWQALAGKVTAAAIPQSQLLQISVVDATPDGARTIADELAHQLILQSPTRTEKEIDRQQEFILHQLQLLQGRITDGEDHINGLENQLALETSARNVQDVQAQIAGLQSKISTWQTTYASLMTQKVGRLNSVNVVEPATLNPVPVSPNTPLNVAVSAAVGFGLALAAIVILEYVDDTFKTYEDVAHGLDVLSLGGVARFPSSKAARGELIMVDDAHSATAEAYRVVRANLEFAMRCTSARAVLITSASVGEGKTTTACNLAVSLAQAGKSVILCDADLRRPSLRQAFDIREREGLTSLLLDEQMPPDRALAPTEVAALWVLPSGPTPPNPAELLGSPFMRERIQELKELADIVLIDAPATLPIADAGIVGLQCDGVILVVDSSRTRRPTVRFAKDRLDQLGLHVIGAILTRTREQRGVDATYYEDELAATARRTEGGIIGRVLGRIPSQSA